MLMMIRSIIIVLLGGILCFSTNCCTNSSKLTIKSNDQKRTEARIDSFFNHAITQGTIPGSVAVIKHQGKIIFHRAYGFKNVESKMKQDTADIFRLASMTKGLTATAILQLNEKKLLSLDDEISKYLPEFKKLKVLDSVYSDSSFTSHDIDSQITIRQLLTHSSGIGYGFQDDNYNKLVLHHNVSEGFCSDLRTSRENTVNIASLPLLQEPGKGFIYSLSYDVLGTIIEIVSGMRYDQYIAKAILNPLEMQNSYFTIPSDKLDKLVNVYEPSPTGKGIIPTSYPDIDYPLVKDKRFFSGGADLCGTAEDYSHFIEMILNGGAYKGRTVLSKESVELMLSKQTEFDDGDSDQGFSTWVTNQKGAQNGPMSVGSFGFGGFFDTYGWADPELQFSSVLLLQMYPNNAVDIHSDYQKLVYELINQIN